MRFCEGINIRLGSGCTTGDVDANVNANANADVVEVELLTADDVRARLREHKERSPVTAPTEATDGEGDGGDDESDVNHVVCPCRSRVTLCGRYTDLPIEIGTWYVSDPSICRDCVEVIDLGCPSCGCHWNERCRKCATRLERLGNVLRRMWQWS